MKKQNGNYSHTPHHPAMEDATDISRHKHTSATSSTKDTLYKNNQTADTHNSAARPNINIQHNVLNNENPSRISKTNYETGSPNVSQKSRQSKSSYETNSTNARNGASGLNGEHIKPKSRVKSGVAHRPNKNSRKPNSNGADRHARAADSILPEITLTKNGETSTVLPTAKTLQAEAIAVALVSAAAKNDSISDNTNQNKRLSSKADVRSSRATDNSSRGRRTNATLGDAPDGGWGWVVVFSSFAISMLVDGVCFSFGIFFDEFKNEFNTSKSATSWVGSVLNGTYLLIGPIVSALVNVYGCRRVAMSGAVLASLGFFISTYSNTLGMLILTYGFMAGFGFGLMYLPAIVMVGYYFEQRRALATGIACCGSGMGAFIFAPFSEYLIDKYGWRGATWLISGLVLNGILFAMAYRSLPDVRNMHGSSYIDYGDEDSEVSSLAMPSEIITGLEPAQSSSGQHVPTIQIEEVARVKPIISVKTSQQAGSPEEVPKGSKTVDVKDLFQTKKGINNRQRPRSLTMEQVSHPKDLTRLTLSQDLGMALRRRNDDDVRAQFDHPPRRNRMFGSFEAVGQMLSPLQRKDIFYSGSLQHICHHLETDVVMPQPETQRFIDESANHTYEDFSIATNSPSSKSFSVAFTSVFDLSLMKSPTFLVYGASCFLCMLGFFVPFVYMPAHAIDLGYDPRSAAFLISIIGITNTLGRVGVGFVSDQPWADCLLINNAALVIGGSSTVFVPYLPSYALLAAYAAVFGSCVAVFVSLRSIIMVELMGLERLTTAFGLVIMCQGMSAFLGAPIAGFLSDYYGNYNAAFCLAGVSLTLSGLICIPLRSISRWESERTRKRDARIIQQLTVESPDLADAAQKDAGAEASGTKMASSLKGNMRKAMGYRVTMETTKYGSDVDGNN